MNEEYQETEITLGRLAKVMFHRKATILISVLTVLPLGVLATKYAYNPSKEKYIAQFSYKGKSVDNSITLCDGSTFNILQLASLDCLKTVKESKTEYNTIDVDEIVKKNAITSEVSITYSSTTGKETDRTYSFTILSSYFDDEDQARNFITDLLNYPTVKNSELQTTRNYIAYLNLYTNAQDYSTKIDYLSNQLNFLDAKYANLSSSFGDYVVATQKMNSVTSRVETITKTISAYKNELDSYFDNVKLGLLSQEVELNYYFFDVAKSEKELTQRQTKLELDKGYAETELAALNTQVTTLLASVGENATVQTLDLGSYNSRIAALMTQINSIDEELDIISKKIAQITKIKNQTETQDYKDNLATFNETLSDTYDFLLEQTNRYIAIENKVYTDEFVLLPKYSGIIYEDGGIGTIVSIIIFGILSLCVGCGINFVIDYKYLREEFPTKEKKTK